MMDGIAAGSATVGFGAFLVDFAFVGFVKIGESSSITLGFLPRFFGCAFTS